MGLLPFVLAAAVVTGPITGGDRGQPFSAMPAADLTLAAYPTHDAFVKTFGTAVDAVVKNGYWLAPEAAAAKKAAQESAIGR